MKKLYTTLFGALLVLGASAQTEQRGDSTFVHFDFDANPWNLPVSIPNRDLGKGGNWATVDDQTGAFGDAYVFEWDVNGEKLLVTMSPEDYMQTDYVNMMVKTHDLNDAEEPIYTMLWTRTGSSLKFTAPSSYWFAKVAIVNYRNWSSGGLYSTDEGYVWGKDSIKVRDYYDSKGVLTYSLNCWEGDSIEWSLPANTGSTFYRYIDFWLLPRPVDAAISEQRVEAKKADVLTLDGMLLRRDGQTDGLKKGVYIVGRKKIVVK